MGSTELYWTSIIMDHQFLSEVLHSKNFAIQYKIVETVVYNFVQYDIDWQSILPIENN